MKRIGFGSLSSTTSTLLLTALVSVAACAAPAEDRGPEASVTGEESELRALASNEIVGDIGFGRTVGPVHYTEVPAYRALRLQAAAGDRGKITITTPNGATALWILGADFATLAQARATGRGRALTLEHTFPTAGAYYLALRDADQEDADFTVTLERAGATPPPPPPPPSSGTVFDAGWCSGSPITKAEILARMATGATKAPLGTLEMAARQRTCNELTGCLGWTAATKVPVSFTERYGGGSYTTQSTVEFGVPQSRPIDIDLTVTSSSDFEPRLTGFNWTAYSNGGWWLALEAKYGLGHDSSRLGHPNGPSGSSPVIGSQSYPEGTATPGVSRFFAGATITNHCYWSKASGRHYGTNRNYTEYDVVLSGRY